MEYTVCNSPISTLQRDYMQFKSITWFKGINTNIQLQKCHVHCSKWAQAEQAEQRLGELLKFGGWRQRWWGTLWRWCGRTAGGVGERLRWAQSSPERGVGSPEAGNTHSQTHFTAPHSLAVPWFLYPSFPPYPPYTANTPAAPALSKLLPCLFLLYSYIINSSLTALDSNQLSKLHRHANVCISTRSTATVTCFS